MSLPSFPNVDISSQPESMPFNALVARHPSHNRGYTVAGLLIMAFFGGIGGGVSRDVLLADIPSPIKDPAYLLVCILMGLLGLAIYRYADSKEERFRTSDLGLLQVIHAALVCDSGRAQGARTQPGNFSPHHAC